MRNAVLFDLDNTLIDRDAAFRECVEMEFSDAGVRATLLQIDDRGEGDRTALFAAWKKFSGRAIDQETLGQMIAKRIRPDTELIRVLETLSTTMKLGIVTNGGSKNQRGKFCAAGFSGAIPAEYVFVSEELGLAKPDPRIFAIAAQSLGETPAACLYIGDSERDVAGARAVGMCVAIVNRPQDIESLKTLLEGQR